MDNESGNASDNSTIQYGDLTALSVALAGAITVVASDARYFDGYDAIIGFLLLSVLIYYEPYEHLQSTLAGKFFVAFSYAICVLLIVGAVFFAYKAFLSPDFFETKIDHKSKNPYVESIIFSWRFFIVTLILIGVSFFRYYLIGIFRMANRGVRDLWKHLAKKAGRPTQ